jgi:hypothetical protein
MLFLNVRLGAVVLGLSVVAGCSLISSDVTNFDLTLPDKKFTIDASNWKVDTTKASSLFSSDGKLMSVSCSSNPSVCSSAVMQACPMDCEGKCNTTSNLCEMKLIVSLSQSVDLMKEKPELESINSEPVIKVSIDSVTYEVRSNSLNVATPEIKVSIAPTSAVTPLDAQAKLIGTIPEIQPGWTTSGPEMMMFTATGKALLVDTMSHFKTPFNVWVGSSLVITAGQPLPQGKLEAVVHITGHAGI